jgi:tripartite-type tricarboxylate transporter receptor subunit TctC
VPTPSNQAGRIPARRLAPLLCALLLAGTAGAGAQDFPTKPIRIVVGFPPGGSNDIGARIVAPRLAELLGVAAVVENKPGANATIGADFVAKASPDGHTLLVASASPMVITPHTFDKIPYDTLKEFAAVSMIGVTPDAIAVNPALGVRTLPELVALSRTREIALSSAGSGGIAHLAIEVFKRESGGRIVHVPYKGAAPAMTDAVAGHVQGIINDLPPLVAMNRDGRLRLIAITDTKRSPFVPDIPTTVEQGMPGLVAVNWLGVFAPAKTPRPVVDKLHGALVQAIATQGVREQLMKAAVAPQSSATPAEFQQFIAAEFTKWGKVAKESGAKMD